MSIDEVISAAYRYGSSRRFESEERSDKRMSTLRTAIKQHVAEEVARETEATLNEVLCGLRSERDTDQVRAIIAEVEAIRARGTT